MPTTPTATRAGLFQIVGFLAMVEVASGVIQGFYTPIFTDIARHLSIHDADVNWFEAAQLMLSAIVVPLLARAGDVYGHKRVLMLATALTAAATWAVAFAPTFPTFLVAWALQGFYVVWLPLEVSIIHRRTRGDERATRQGAGVLVAVLEASVIVAALSSGALSGRLGMTALLSVPAVAVTVVLAAIWFGVPDVRPESSGRLDWLGFGVLSAALLLLLAGLILLRLQGPASPWPWVLIAASLATFVPFVRTELAVAEPLVDLRILSAPGQWPIQVTAALFGASVLGAQIPLSTFARTDPAVTGYGLGATASQTSLLIGAYVITLALGALAMPPLARRIGSPRALAAGAFCVALGYVLFLPFHASYVQTLTNMAIAGFGSGALVAALPAAAAARAPSTHTGLVTGMTNTTKTLGGSIASAVFALALLSTGSLDKASGHAPLAGYLTVWAVCAATAAAAGVILVVLSGRRPA
jgi:MFS family permease